MADADRSAIAFPSRRLRIGAERDPSFNRKPKACACAVNGAASQKRRRLRLSFNRDPDEAAALNVESQIAVEQQPLAGSASPGNALPAGSCR